MRISIFLTLFLALTGCSSVNKISSDYVFPSSDPDDQETIIMFFSYFKPYNSFTNYKIEFSNIDRGRNESLSIHGSSIFNPLHEHIGCVVASMPSGKWDMYAHSFKRGNVFFSQRRYVHHDFELASNKTYWLGVVYSNNAQLQVKESDLIKAECIKRASEQYPNVRFDNVIDADYTIRN